jgi:hypothetical protein
LSEKEYFVLAMQTGRRQQPAASNAQNCARAESSTAMSSAP